MSNSDVKPRPRRAMPQVTISPFIRRKSDAALEKQIDLPLEDDCEIPDVVPSPALLPWMKENQRIEPNHLARSNLYAPIANKARVFHKGTELISRPDCTIKYWGEQLDEADADIVMQLMYEASRVPLGTAVKMDRHAFLTAIRRDTGGKQYEWLEERLDALTLATMFITTRNTNGTTKYRIGGVKTRESFRIISKLKTITQEDGSKDHVFIMDPRWVVLCSNKEYALIDWVKRMEIGRGQSMAKTLQRLIATSKTHLQQYGLDYLKVKMNYKGRMRDFTTSLQQSLYELERVGVIAEGKIELNTRGKMQASWIRL